MVDADLNLESSQLERELKNYEAELADIRNGDQEIQRLRSEHELAVYGGNALDELLNGAK